MIKRTATFLLLLCVFASGVLAADFNPVDIQPGRYYYDQVKILFENGIMLGDGNGYFRPEDDVTRAEYCALLNRTFGLAETRGAAEFADVDYAENSWKSNAIEVASAYGYLQGDGERAYPDRTITRYEAFMLLGRILGFAERKTETEFTDNEQIPPWARPMLAALYDAGIINGFGDGSLDIGNLTRGQAAVAILNAVPDLK